jgi:hypothetical protein
MQAQAILCSDIAWQSGGGSGVDYRFKTSSVSLPSGTAAMFSSENFLPAWQGEKLRPQILPGNLKSHLQAIVHWLSCQADGILASCKQIIC